MDMSKYTGALFLKVADIKGNKHRVKIVDVREGKFEKPDLTFDDGTRLSCNATNGRTLARFYGFDSNDWIDKEIELFVGTLEYQGKAQEAILIKPISPPLEKPKQNSSEDDFGRDEIPF
jgi:hypothetical protein